MFSLKDLIQNKKGKNKPFNKKLEKEKEKIELLKDYQEKLPSGCKIKSVDLSKEIIVIKCDNSVSASEAKMVDIKGFQKKIKL